MEDVDDSLPYTVELQWLEHLWNHENMFETGVVRAMHNATRHKALIKHDV